jgi:hypothetical protein
MQVYMNMYRACCYHGLSHSHCPQKHKTERIRLSQPCSSESILRVESAQPQWMQVDRLNALNTPGRSKELSKELSKACSRYILPLALLRSQREIQDSGVV